MAELLDLQKSITRTRAARGFVTDPVKIHVLLTEKIGEIASEIKRLWSKNYGNFSRDRLKEEIADVFVLLAALAAHSILISGRRLLRSSSRKIALGCGNQR